MVRINRCIDARKRQFGRGGSLIATIKRTLTATQRAANGPIPAIHQVLILFPVLYLRRLVLFQWYVPELPF